jgi:hypothetical protein
MFYNNDNILLCVRHHESDKGYNFKTLNALIEEVMVAYEQAKYKICQLILLSAHMKSICMSELIDTSYKNTENIKRMYHEVMERVLENLEKRNMIAL